ncbi:MAG: tRNA (adenosine(37)-N6)-threonylcarbamoyltransferase complex dimerization subunit type 1 TsaB [Acidobacteriaceae bacterium]|nr:tRNA (adenosine(37)-N6)-threonylcarbamoyltransferase complex dimerization subunit type 1 TsaB [Acidobacteriaceae bacterium]
MLLVIETSSDPFQIALGAKSGVLFDSRHAIELSESRDLARALVTGLKQLGASTNDLNGIALDIGPGGLSYIRSGVSFANALAFSLHIPIYAFNSFQIMGSEARQRTSLPVLCGIGAASGLAYVALVNDASLVNVRFGLLSSAIAELSKGLPAIAVAGKIRHQVSDLLPGVDVIDTGIERPNAPVLLDLAIRAVENRDGSLELATPLNEEAAIFYA